MIEVMKEDPESCQVAIWLNVDFSEDVFAPQIDPRSVYRARTNATEDVMELIGPIGGLDDEEYRINYYIEKYQVEKVTAVFALIDYYYDGGRGKAVADGDGVNKLENAIFLGNYVRELPTSPDPLPVTLLTVKVEDSQVGDYGGFEGFISSNYSMDHSMLDTQNPDTVGFRFYTTTPGSLRDLLNVGAESSGVLIQITEESISRDAYLAAKKRIDEDCDDESDDITLP